MNAFVPQLAMGYDGGARDTTAVSPKLTLHVSFELYGGTNVNTDDFMTLCNIHFYDFIMNYGKL